MASDGNNLPCHSHTSMVKVKRARKTAPLISMAATQSCIAASMAKVINNMSNPMLLHHCMYMLQIDNPDHARDKILELLQRIDFDILMEQEKKDKAMKAKAKKNKEKKK